MNIFGIDREKLQERFNKFTIPEPNSGCLIWLGGGRPYGTMNVNSGHERRMVQATHVALALAGRPLSMGLQACHICDCPWCVNEQHLFEGTSADNNQDAIRKGRAAPPPSFQGWKHSADDLLKMRAAQKGRIISLQHRDKLSIAAKRQWDEGKGSGATGYRGQVPRLSHPRKLKLSADQVSAIRLSVSRSAIDLAKEYGVAVSYIYALRNGEKRKDLS